MRGTSNTTGKPLDGDAHLAQSIGDILSTPLGTRVMRRDYGSELTQLIDQPFNRATQLRLFAAVATALMRWEPRVRLSSVAIDIGGASGQFTVTVNGVRIDTPRPLSTSVTVPLQLTAV